MNLIQVQKSVQSIGLAVNRKADLKYLLPKISKQLVALRLEANAADEEELAAVAGQVSAYIDTVAESRLNLGQEGLAVIGEFVRIFKDAFGDAAPGVGSLNKKHLNAWERRYQTLMAEMQPMSATTAPFVTDTEVVDLRPPVYEDIGVDQFSRVDEEWPEPELPVDTYTEAAEDETPEFAEPEPEEIPFYNPAEEPATRDAIISDAEIKTAREAMELGEPVPETRRSTDRIPRADSRGRVTEPPRAAERPEPLVSSESSVQFEELERLKQKLLQLQESQENLSSKMSGMLDGIKQTASDEEDHKESESVEQVDISDLEDLIFIGRRKG